MLLKNCLIALHNWLVGNLARVLLLHITLFFFFMDLELFQFDVQNKNYSSFTSLKLGATLFINLDL